MSPTSLLSHSDTAVGGVAVVSSTRVLAADPVAAVVCTVGVSRD